MSRFISFSQKIMRQTKDLIGKGKKRFARKASDERGALMLEAIALLGLMTLMSPMLVKQTSEKTQEVEEVTIAGQMKMLRDAAMSYIDANLASLGDTSAAGAFGAGYTGADGEKQSIVLNNRDLAAFLPPGFCLEEGGDCVFQNRLVENYRAAVVRQHSCDTRDAGGQRTEECRPFDYTVLIVSGPRATGGAAPEIADRRAMRIASMIGADGGFIPSANVAAVSGNASQISVLGSQGIWEIENVQDFFAANSGWTPGRGQVAVTTVYKGNATLGEFLYRKPTAVEGGNAMFTDLDMAGAQGIPNDEDGIVTEPTQAGAPHDIKGIKGLFVDSDGGLYVRDLARNTTLPGDENFVSYNSATQAAMMPRAQFTRNTMSTGDYKVLNKSAIGKSVDGHLEHRIRHNLNSAGMEEVGETSIIHAEEGVVQGSGALLTPDGIGAAVNRSSVYSELKTRGGFGFSDNGNKHEVSRDNFYNQDVGLLYKAGKDIGENAFVSNSSLNVLASTNYVVQRDLMTTGQRTETVQQVPVITAETTADGISQPPTTTKVELMSINPYLYQTLQDNGSVSGMGLVQRSYYGGGSFSTQTNGSAGGFEEDYRSGLYLRPYSLVTDEFSKTGTGVNYLKAAHMVEGPSTVIERERMRDGTRTKTSLEMLSDRFGSGFDKIKLASEFYEADDAILKGGLEFDTMPVTDATGLNVASSDSPRFKMGVEDMSNGLQGGEFYSYYSGLSGIAARVADRTNKQEIATQGQLGGGFFSTTSGGYGKYDFSKDREHYRSENEALNSTEMVDKFAGVKYSMNEAKYQALSENSASINSMPQRAGLESYSFHKTNDYAYAHDSEAFINTMTGVFATYGEQLVDWSTFDLPDINASNSAAATSARTKILKSMSVGNSYRPMSRIAMGTKDVIGEFDYAEGSRYLMTSLNMEPITYGSNSSTSMYAPSVRLGASINGEQADISKNNSLNTELKMYAYEKNPRASLFVTKTYNETSKNEYIGNSMGGNGYNFFADAEAQGGLETSIIEYNQTVLNQLYGKVKRGKILNSANGATEIRTRLVAKYDQGFDRERFRTAPYFDANGRIMPEAINSVKYDDLFDWQQTQTWNVGAAQLDLSNFTNILRDSGDSSDFQGLGTLYDNGVFAMTPYAPQATLSAISSDEDLLARLNLKTPDNYFPSGSKPDFYRLTKAAQLKLQTTSMVREAVNSNATQGALSFIPSASLDALLVREGDYNGKTIKEGSSLTLDSYDTVNSALPQLRSTLSTERTLHTTYRGFRNEEDWLKERFTTADIYKSNDLVSIYRMEKASLNMRAGQKNAGVNSSQLYSALDLTARAQTSSSSFSDSNTRDSIATLVMNVNNTHSLGKLQFSAANVGARSGVAFNASKNMSEASISAIALNSSTDALIQPTGFFAKVYNPSINTFNFVDPASYYGSLNVRGSFNEPAWSYESSNVANSIPLANSFAKVTLNRTDGYRRYGVRTKAVGGLMIAPQVGSAPIAEFTATYNGTDYDQNINNPLLTPKNMYGRLLLGRGTPDATQATIDLDTRYWKILDGYIELTGSERQGGNYAPLMAYYMAGITYGASGTSLGGITLDSKSNSDTVVKGVFNGQLKTTGTGATAYNVSSGFWGDKTLRANAPAASMFKHADGNYYEIYNKFRLDPAYVSVMNDIKLTSRGGANLSDILPNYVLKSIYTLTNQYAKGPWPCQTTAENGNIISIAANGWKTQYNRDDANPGNCSFVIPRGRLVSAKKVPDTMTSYISNPGYLPIWENDCSFMNRFGDRNYCLTKTTKYTYDGTPRSMYVSYAANNYKKCKDTYNPSQCLTHPYMGSVAAPGMTMQVDGEYFDDRESGMCPAGYLPVMTVTPTAFDVGKVIFIDAGSTGETKYGAGVYGKFTDNTLKYVPYNVYGAQWNNWDNYATPASDTDYINSDVNFVESHRFVNFGHQDYTEEVPSIYQPATRIAVAAKPLCAESSKDCRDSNFTGEMMADSSYGCSATRSVLCGWVVAMGTVTPNKVKTNPDTSPDYFWNMGGIFQNTMQAVVHTYCYFNPQNFYFPNMRIDPERGALRPLDNPSLLYNENAHHPAM